MWVNDKWLVGGGEDETKREDMMMSVDPGQPQARVFNS